MRSAKVQFETASFGAVAVATFALLGVGLAAGPVRAQPTTASRTAAHFVARQITAPIHVDGHLDEPAWQEPPTLTLDLETNPGENVPAPVHTAVWIVYDRARLYVAFRADDPHPERIQARLSDRDAASLDDTVGLALDTFNDQRRGFEFFVNPLGVQSDYTLNDVTGNEDASWDAIWDSAARITERGWEAEIAIPFSSLRFPRTEGPQTWGIDVVRIWPRDVQHRFGLHALPRGRNCYLCYESKLDGIAGVAPGRNIELDPTLTANRTETRDDLQGPFTSTSKVDPGITARWGITPGMTLNATVNPDFSQVEADAAQLSVNTQFELFYPEKRPFFLEGADLFDSKINAVYTRNIVDPSWGLKLTGKQGPNAVGVIVAHDQTTNLLFPSSQASDFGNLARPNTSSLLRYRRDVTGVDATVGALFAGREADGYHNRVLGLDGYWRPDEATQLRLEVLTSDTLYPDSIQSAFGQPAGARSGHALRAAYHWSTRDWTVHADYNDVSRDFRDDLGFIPQVDYRKEYAFVERNFWGNGGDGHHWYSRLTWGAETTWTHDSQGAPLQHQWAPYVSFAGPRQSNLMLYFGNGPSWYKGVRFDRTFLAWMGEAQPLTDLHASFEGRVGQEIDYANTRQGNLVSLYPTLRWTPGRHLRLQLGDAYQTLRSGGGRLFTAHLVDMRVTYQISVRTFVRLVTQYFHIDRDPALYVASMPARDAKVFNQLLFSFKLNPQTVLFLGYSDGYRDDVALQLRQASRAIFCKVGYAIVR